ncbi:MAG: hypothetical protein GWP08_17735 [Nitrospiraceae bacterium]|nr:hypothetical protein [Nitrospiraceae bacterium]
MRLLTILGVWVCGCGWATPPAVRLDLSEDWTPHTQGAWRMRYDHRELLAMRHPWQESAKGDYASTSREVTVPPDWREPVFLTFYCSDDYNTDTWRPDGSWLTAEGFIGHRLKQVLVDSRVVWSQDVSDPVVKGRSPVYRVALDVSPGQSFVLTLLAYDTVGSATVLEGDFHQYANDAKPRSEDPDANKFMTHVYWGDLALVEGETTPKPGQRPSEKAVRAVHTKRWPLAPFGGHWDGPIRLQVSAPKGVPKDGFPLRFGVPFHAGALTDPAQLRLTDSRGRRIYAQYTPQGEWPDDSIQWLLLDFPIKPGMEEVRISRDGQRGQAPRPPVITQKNGVTQLKSTPVALTAAIGYVIKNIQFQKKTRIESVELALDVDGETFFGTTESVTIVERGPFRATLRLDGRFSSLDHAYAHFELWVSTFTGLPQVRLWLRLFNDTAVDLPVSGLSVRVNLPEESARIKTPYGPVGDGASMEQIDADTRRFNGADVDADSPAFFAWDGGAMVVRHFRELHPKQLSLTGTSLVADLVAASGAPVVFTPGEAHTEEVWLALGPVDAQAFANAVSSPPILQNAEYYCSTGVLGPARPHRGVPVLHEHMRDDFGEKRWEDFGQRFGVRDFTDSPYYGGLPKWSNNYYERMLGLYSEWFMSGDRAWFDRAAETCRHLLDVAIVHSPVPGKDWLGAIHGPGENHVSGPWNPTLRIAGLAIHQKLTGAPDAREAFLGVADFCVRTDAGIRGGSVRQQAGPFDAICTAYEETGDVRYLEDGARRVAGVLDALDMRRGVWPDEHGSKVYRGNVPWMVAQIARPLYLWYHATGDVKAAQALVGLAESIICENTDWDDPGVVSGYSHNPHFDVSANYDLIILPIIFAAYELTEDPFFLDAAKAQWARWIREKAFDSPLNCHWNTPWLVWYLREYGVVEQAPPNK